jgi:hypothetical protein
MKTTQIIPNFFINSFKLNTKEEVKTPLKTNHIIVIDCSGSMYGDLPQIRKQLKNKISMIVQNNDTLTVIWFSGRNQSGFIFENLEIKDLTDLAKVHSAIDKYLTTVGLTSFVEPLKNVVQSVKQYINQNDRLTSLFFMTDGYDNCNNESDILKQVTEISSLVNAATFVEYGYYCNHKLLQKMAEKSGGELIFSSDFNEYDVQFDKNLSKTLNKNRIVHTMPTEPLFQTVFALGNDNTFLNFSVNNKNEILIPDSSEYTFFYFSNTPVYVNFENETKNIMLAGIYVLNQKLQPKYVSSLVKKLDSLDIYKQYSKSFGKQKLNLFNNTILDCIIDNRDIYANGLISTSNISNNLTLLDILYILSEDDENRFMVKDPSFKYKRIGAKKVAKDNFDLSESDKKEIIKSLDDINNPEEFKNKIDELISLKNKNLIFNEDDYLKNNGASFSTIVFNSERANISLTVRTTGHVELPDNSFNLPKLFPTFKYNNYTILKDGILNVEILPVKLSFQTFLKLKNFNIFNSDVDYQKDNIYNLDLNKIAIVNDTNFDAISDNVLFETYYTLNAEKAKNKVYKNYLEKLQPKVSKTWLEEYGEDAVVYLKSFGLTDYNGFNPSVVTVKSDENDFYFAPVINVKIKGLSSLTSVDAVNKKIKENKNLNVADKLMKVPIDTYTNFQNTPDFIKLDDKEKEIQLVKFLENKLNESKSFTKSLNKVFSEQIFTIILSQTWFNEEFTEHSKTLQYNNETLECSVVIEDEQITI